MQELNMMEVDEVSGGVGSDAVYGAAVGAAVGFLAIGVAITLAAPAAVVFAGLMYGASICSSGAGILVFRTVSD